MRIISVISCVVVGVVTVFGATALAQSNAEIAAAALAGRDKLTAENSPECKLFTVAELTKYVGVPLVSGQVAAMGTACQWTNKAGSGSVMIQVAPARYHEPHTGAKSFRKLPDVGTRGFVEESMGGWNAGAISGDKTIVVSVQGAAATDATAIALLKETIKRRSVAH